MDKCCQCDKEAVMEVGGKKLCIDCSLKLQQIYQIEHERNVNFLNFLLAQAEMNVGLPGILPRYKIPKPVVVNSPTFNNIKLDNSNVGILNTGEIHQLDANIDLLKGRQDNKELAKLINEFAQTIIDSNEIKTGIKNELIEHMTFISSEVSKPKSERKKNIAKTILSGIKETASTITVLIPLWEKLYPHLQEIFS